MLNSTNTNTLFIYEKQYIAYSPQAACNILMIACIQFQITYFNRLQNIP